MNAKGRCLHCSHWLRRVLVLPPRAKQLLQTYAPGGQRPLLPGPQDSSKAKISVTKVETSGPAGEHYIQIANGVRVLLSTTFCDCVPPNMDAAHAGVRREARRGVMDGVDLGWARALASVPAATRGVCRVLNTGR